MLSTAQTITAHKLCNQDLSSVITINSYILTQAMEYSWLISQLCYIISLVINSLRGKQAHTQTHIYIDKHTYMLQSKETRCAPAEVCLFLIIWYICTYVLLHLHTYKANHIIIMHIPSDSKSLSLLSCLHFRFA